MMTIKIEKICSAMTYIYIDIVRIDTPPYSPFS